MNIKYWLKYDTNFLLTSLISFVDLLVLLTCFEWENDVFSNSFPIPPSPLFIDFQSFFQVSALPLIWAPSYLGLSMVLHNKIPWLFLGFLGISGKTPWLLFWNFFAPSQLLKDCIVPYTDSTKVKFGFVK